MMALCLVAPTWGATPEISTILAGTRKVLIVPVEPPPLKFDSPGVTPIAAQVLGVRTDAGSGSGVAPVTTAGKGVAAAGIVVGLVGASNAARESTDLTVQVVDALSAGGTWIPTRAVADIVASELTARGVKSIRVRDGLEPIPGVTDRSITFLMHNWYGPVGLYYDMTKSPFDYATTDVGSDELIIEVAMYRYIYNSCCGPLVLGIQLKLVDPKSGATLAKARTWDMEGIRVMRTFNETGQSEPKVTFANGGAVFKTRFASKAQEVTETVLKKLGF
jgi:hypothetical protein